MRITVELSLYPLADDFMPKIEAFITTLRSELGRRRGLDLRVNQMSTQLVGELGDVMAVLESALASSFGDRGHGVLVAKFLNVDLPIHSTPQI